MSAQVLIQQHLIDPEICIRCNTCETMCPVGAITHDSRNYVVDASKCNWCNDCISPCPTGSIDNYRKVLKVKAYSLAEQLSWDVLPAELADHETPAVLDRGVGLRVGAGEHQRRDPLGVPEGEFLRDHPTHRNPEQRGALDV